MNHQHLLRGMLVGVMAFANPPANGDDFRIDSMVFRDGEENAICRNVTLLIGHRSYDELHGPSPEVTIIDMDETKLTVLDPLRKRRTELTFEKLANFVHTASARAATSRAFVRFAARPNFTTKFSPEKRLLELKAADMTYRVETVAAPNATVAVQFRNFADWTARLNTVRPGLPPAARLLLNQQLFAHRHLPANISRTVVDSSASPLRLTSRHEYTWKLSAEDRAKVAKFDDWETQFESVDLHTMFYPLESPPTQSR
jgi:hypothetical protein